MLKRLLNKISLVIILVAFTAGSSIITSECFAEPQQKTKKKTAPKKTQPAASTTRKRKTSSSGQSAKKETSADVKKKEQETRREIKETEEKIKKNDLSVKQGLSELGKLQEDITESKGKIAGLSKTISELNTRINSLENNISENEAELKKLRDEYLKAIKKMRVTKKNKSDLVFLFSSENFNQAVRRMRYLKQFSEWQHKQTEAIGEKVAELKEQKGELAVAKEKQDAQLQTQQSIQNQLESQYKKQDELVAQLRKNGKALETHLSKKQAEANDLRNRVSALIAEEQRKEAEEKARREAEERAKAESARKAAEEAELLAQAKSSEKKDDKAAKQERKRKTKDSDKKNDKKTESTTVYADARKRNPRGNSSSSSSETSSNPSQGSSFSSMKGSLPHPASGSFKVTSRFGQQSLPDLPDIVYDNPGIDAEVSAGANALAVYTGNVSGVYMVPGYNTVVIVNHGNYYTVYGNISSPSVKVGDKVQAGQGLGTLASDEDDSGRSSIHFEVWRNREKLNPLDWIKN